jgi:pimeloyl-ACP methyl ester carboxylesterase
MLAFRTEGDAGGLPIVMVHPLGADQSFWDECRRHFGGSVLTVSCDLRGSGASPDLDRPLTLERAVADLEELRRHLGLERIVMAGCAVGAMAAALYASRYQASMAGLVLSNPGIRIAGNGAADLRRRAELVRGSGMAALLPQAIENAFVGYADTPRRHAYEARFIRQKTVNYAFAAEGVAGADIAACLPAIRCPVLVIPGDNDRLFGMPHCREVCDLLARSEMVRFEAGAHFIPYQQPEEFGTVVAAFLDRNRLRA